MGGCDRISAQCRTFLLNICRTKGEEDAGEKIGVCS